MNILKRNKQQSETIAQLEESLEIAATPEAEVQTPAPAESLTLEAPTNNAEADFIIPTQSVVEQDKSQAERVVNENTSRELGDRALNTGDSRGEINSDRRSIDVIVEDREDAIEVHHNLNVPEREDEPQAA